MFTERTSVGLDVHARSVVGTAIDGFSGELVKKRLDPDRSGANVVGWVKTLPGPVAVTYEAGPTGFGLARAFSAAGIRCEVAAPSLIVRPAGEKRVKTDERDALLLARLLRLEEIVPVQVPTVEQEAARDLVRAREAARQDLMRARHRVSKLALRYGYVYPRGKTTWNAEHELWLGSLWFEQAATRAAFAAHLDAVRCATERRHGLDVAIHALVTDSPFTAVVRRLGCLRGISELTGIGLAVEIGDWDRFTGASIGAYLGLVPSEHSSGESRHQGGITKSGNRHARRLLVEAAWHHQRPYVVRATLRDRWKLAPPAARARGDQGNQRLHARWLRFLDRKKNGPVANTAIARELAGWCWSLATLPENPTETTP